MIKAEENPVFERINQGQPDIYGNVHTDLGTEINRLIDLLEKYAPQMEQKDIDVSKTCIGRLKNQMDGVLSMFSGVWSRDDIESSFSRLALEHFGIEDGFHDLYEAAVQKGILREYQILENLIQEDSLEEEQWAIYLHDRLDKDVLSVLQEMKETGMLPEPHGYGAEFNLS